MFRGGGTYTARIGPVGDGRSSEDAVLFKRRGLLLVGGGTTALNVAVVAGYDVPLGCGLEVGGLLLVDALFEVGLYCPPPSVPGKRSFRALR